MKEKTNKTPIVMVAFGTTGKALDTYGHINEYLTGIFPGREILWAYSSRMVRDWIKVRRGIRLMHPHEILEELSRRGEEWAVVQSLHVMCAHEFYRLVEEVGRCPIRTSMGLPLLAHPGDYAAVADAVRARFNPMPGEALVLVGHGTDHPAWSCYPALTHVLRERIGPHVVVGVVEGDPSLDDVMSWVRRGGYGKVRLIPLMLVAGTHFNEDLVGGGDSWRCAFEAVDIEVNAVDRGIGLEKRILDVFSLHIRDALACVPGERVDGAGAGCQAAGRRLKG